VGGAQFVILDDALTVNSFFPCTAFHCGAVECGCQWPKPDCVGSCVMHAHQPRCVATGKPPLQLRTLPPSPNDAGPTRLAGQAAVERQGTRHAADVSAMDIADLEGLTNEEIQELLLGENGVGGWRGGGKPRRTLTRTHTHHTLTYAHKHSLGHLHAHTHVYIHKTHTLGHIDARTTTHTLANTRTRLAH
jgi:hypothetical protein